MHNLSVNFEIKKQLPQSGQSQIEQVGWSVRSSEKVCLCKFGTQKGKSLKKQKKNFRKNVTQEG